MRGEFDGAPFALGAARVVRETERALLVALDASSLLGAGQRWIPKVVVHDDSEVYAARGDGAEGRLVVKRWFARKEGWETE